MRRLIHNQWLYVGLIVLVGVLYARVALQGLGPMPHHEPKPQPAAPLSWTEGPSDAELFRQVISGERPGASALLLFGLVMLGMGVGGLGLTTWGLATGQFTATWRYAASRPPAWNFGDVGRILLLTVGIAMLMPFVRLAAAAINPVWSLDDHVWLTASMLLLDVFVALAICTFALNKSGRLSDALGLSWDRAGAVIREALRDYVALFPWLFLLLLLALGASRALGLEPPVEPIHQLLFQEQRPVVVGMTVMLAGVVGPLAEELFFRGVLYGALRQRNSRIVSMLISGAVFALVHTNHVGFLPILALGSLLAFVYERTGSLLAPIAIHIVHNSLLLGLAMVVRSIGPLG